MDSNIIKIFGIIYIFCKCFKYFNNFIVYLMFENSIFKKKGCNLI